MQIYSDKILLKELYNLFLNDCDVEEFSPVLYVTDLGEPVPLQHSQELGTLLSVV